LYLAAGGCRRVFCFDKVLSKLIQKCQMHVPIN
jgi:hypothetical protein